MLAISEFPEWMKGDLYNTLMDAGDETTVLLDEIQFIEKKIKSDLTINCLSDIFEIIDTCHYVGVDLPYEVLEYTLQNHKKIAEEMENLTLIERQSYEYFMTTREYLAVDLCVNFIKENPNKEDVFMYEIGNSHSRFYYIIKFIRYSIQYNSLLLVSYLEYRYFTNWYHSKICKDVKIHILLTTAEHGHVEIMKYWSQKEWFESVTKKRENQGEIMMYAASYGNLPMLKYLRETLGFHFDQRIFEMTLKHNHFECLRYMIKNKFYISSSILRKAIIYKYPFEIVRFLVEEVDIPLYDPTLTLIAVERNSMDIVKYLHEKNAVWHIDAVGTALQYGFKEIATYCIEKGAPYHQDVLELYNTL